MENICVCVIENLKLDRLNFADKCKTVYLFSIADIGTNFVPALLAPSDENEKKRYSGLLRLVEAIPVTYNNLRDKSEYVPTGCIAEPYPYETMLPSFRKYIDHPRVLKRDPTRKIVENWFGNSVLTKMTQEHYKNARTKRGTVVKRASRHRKKEEKQLRKLHFHRKEGINPEAGPSYVTSEAINTEFQTQTQTPTNRKRKPGRPPGSKNKKKAKVAPESHHVGTPHTQTPEAQVGFESQSHLQSPAYPGTSHTDVLKPATSTPTSSSDKSIDLEAAMYATRPETSATRKAPISGTSSATPTLIYRGPGSQDTVLEPNTQTHTDTYKDPQNLNVGTGIEHTQASTPAIPPSTIPTDAYTDSGFVLQSSPPLLPYIPQQPYTSHTQVPTPATSTLATPTPSTSLPTFITSHCRNDIRWTNKNKYTDKCKYIHTDKYTHTNKCTRNYKHTVKCKDTGRGKL